MKTTGDMIKHLRKQKGLTQDDLAIALGLKKTTIQKYEANVVKNLKIDTIRKLCLLFDATPWFFVFPEQTGLRAEDEKDELIKQALGIVKYYSFLNEEGRERIFQYIEDIVEIEKYRTPESQELQTERNNILKMIRF